LLAGCIAGVLALGVASFVGVSAAWSSTASGADAGLSCGQTITVDTTLTADLSCPNGDGLLIAASDVTLDLAGHTLSGGGVGTGIQGGDFLDPPSNITIKNGTVSGFGIGLSFVQVHGLTLSGVTASHNVGNGVSVFARRRSSRDPERDRLQRRSRR
jgi:hypothetical protein